MTQHSPASPQASPIKRTPLYQLVEEKLGEPVAQFIAARREQDPPIPYYQIAYEVQQSTGVTVTHEAIRRWYIADGGTEQPAEQPPTDQPGQEPEPAEEGP